MNRSEDLSTLNHMVESKFTTRTTNQKRYSDLGSDASSVWNFCVCISDVIWRGNVVASPNVNCFLRLGLRVKPAKNYSARTARRWWRTLVGRISLPLLREISWRNFFFSNKRRQIKFFSPSKLWLNSFKMWRFRCRRIVTARHTFAQKRNY